MKEDKPGWQKSEPVERVYVKYDSKNNILTHEDNLPNQREKEVKELKKMFVSLTRLTKTSPLHRNIYSDGTLDLGILVSNISNG